MQLTYRSRTIRSGGGMARQVPWLIVVLGLGLLTGAGFAVWSELEFRKTAVETDGRVVALIPRLSHDSDGHTSRTYTPVFTFSLPNGKEVRAEGSVSSDPPCCAVGEAVRVRYDPARPERAAMVGFMESWFVAVLLGGMGVVFTGCGILARRVVGRGVQAAGAVAAMPAFAVPLAGLRRKGLGRSMRWIIQARWSDPRSGRSRLFESDPLPFDPVPQMRQMSTVQVQFDPGQPDGPYWMDLSFLTAPDEDADATIVAGPVRRG